MKNMNIAQVKNEASSGSLIKSTHIDSLCDVMFEKVILTRPGQDTMILDSLTSVSISAQAGDIITVKGNHDIGNIPIILSNGVCINCIGDVSISGSNSTSGTIYVLSSATASIKGLPTIYNSNGLTGRIVNSGGKLKEFFWKYETILQEPQSGVYIADVIFNNMGGDPIITDVASGTIGLTLSGAFTNKIGFVCNSFNDGGNSNDLAYTTLLDSSQTVLPHRIAFFMRKNSSAFYSTPLNDFYLCVKVYV
jgi:hypothetical protein